MALSEDISQIEEAANTERAQILRQRRRLVGAHDLAVRLFYGADGQLSEAAIEWLAELGRHCFAEHPTWDLDPRAHAFNEGRRAVFLEIMHGLALDTRRLAMLSRQLKETEDE
ncbi:hypothetical protein [Sphingomonas oligoaromativorans]|uniref:Bbp19 family protein n=1 Tax=Sphingomonas oligoaromativorans TaxID=575322 RepID=UPI00141E6364|nr:hypothetical protein [Sphingomonas oligoaromativorans]NIJ34332.1 hypothetical protein [Sphingomonas oligoaromativorans]